MNPTYAEAIDPIFLHVLRLLEDLSFGKQKSPEEERERILWLFRDAEAKIGSKQGWELIKYALASWVDEVLIIAPWEGRRFWTNNSLEFDYFNTRHRATRFFQQAVEADKLTRSDASEVYYICVVLGFRGFYANPADATYAAAQLKLPETIEDWTRRTARKIKLSQPPEPTHEPRALEGAPALHGKFMLVGSVLLTVMMTATFIVVFWMFLWERAR